MSNKSKQLGPHERVIYFPHKSDYYSTVVVSVLRSFGYNAQVLPESDKESLYWAKKVNFNKECMPAIIQTGDMIRKVMSPDFDPDKSAFFGYHGNLTPCRNGQEGTILKIVLSELGFPQVPVYATAYPDGKFLTDLKDMPKGEFYKATFKGTCAVDILSRALHETRPYEVNKGETNQVYQKAIDKLAKAMENRSSLVKVLKEARSDFENIKVENRGSKNLIGILGEVYVRIVPFSNNRAIENLERLGVEVWMAPLFEWQLAASFLSLAILKRRKKYFEYVKFLMGEYKLIHEERQMVNTFKGYLRRYTDYSINGAIKKQKPYMRYNSSGCDVPWYVSSTVEFIEKGVDGILCLMPFTCIHGNIFSAILKKIRDDYNNIPCLLLPFEPLEVTNTNTRLEAFVYQVNEYKKAKVK